MFLHILRKDLRLFLKDNCRPFYCIWYGRRKESWTKVRYISSAMMGALCAYLLCKIFLASFLFPRKYEKIVLSLAVASISKSLISGWMAQKSVLMFKYIYIFLGCGFVFSDSIKCVVFLIFVALMGKSGRGYLRALCFAFVMAGTFILNT